MNFESIAQEEPSKEKIVELFKQQGKQSKEATRMLGEWISQQEKKVNNTDDEIKLSMSIGDIWRDSGVIEQAQNAYYDAFNVAQSEPGHEDIFVKALEEIKKIEQHQQVA